MATPESISTAGVNEMEDNDSLDLYANLLREVPDQVKRVLESECDIDPTFLGFVSTYRLLAALIPRDWWVVDLGCAYAPQSYYFREHRKYFGVDFTPTKQRFRFHNTAHYEGNIVAWLKNWRDTIGDNTSTVFAICNYVPPWDGFNRKMVGDLYENLYVFYPARPEHLRGAAR